jgi:hypothetical protein
LTVDDLSDMGGPSIRTTCLYDSVQAIGANTGPIRQPTAGVIFHPGSLVRGPKGVVKKKLGVSGANHAGAGRVSELAQQRKSDCDVLRNPCAYSEHYTCRSGEGSGAADKEFREKPALVCERMGFEYERTDTRKDGKDVAVVMISDRLVKAKIDELRATETDQKIRERLESHTLWGARNAFRTIYTDLFNQR